MSRDARLCVFARNKVRQEEVTMKTRRNSFYYIWLIGFPLIFGYCAKMGSITGGPKDEDPPEVVGSKPENYSTNFTGNRIEITFNEFISLNNVNQELIISPPLKGKPDIRLRGKTIQINLEGDYRENVTYTLNFGNSIEDVNERNILENFEFVFSTGNSLDSLSVEGAIVNSFNLQPSEDPFIIMVYDNLDDSIPMKEIPVYIGRSDKKGNFRINNMKADTFRIFALKDLNYNYIYDLPNEMIAFYDSLIYLFPDSLLTKVPVNEKKSYSDSLHILLDDTIQIKEPELDSTVFTHDSTDQIPVLKTVLKPYYMDLFFFEEDRRMQYLTDDGRKEDRHIFLAFNLPVKEKLDVQGLNFSAEDWYYEEANLSRDTFNLWIKDMDLIKSDTLSLLVNYPGTDSLGNYTTVKDTIDMITRTRPGRTVSEEVKKPELIIKTIANNSKIDIHKRIFISFSYPVSEVDTSKIVLYSVVDTLETEADFLIESDTLSLRNRYLARQWESKMKYRLFAEPGAFIDIYGNVNDSLQLNFSVQDEEHYGVLHVKTQNVPCPLIVQLMDEKEYVKEEKYIDSDAVLTFTYLNPGRYKVKYLYDTNTNQRWDTGNYLMGRQPEKVEYYDGEIVIRSNWEMEINWEMKRDSIFLQFIPD